MSLQDELLSLQERLRSVEERLSESGYDTKRIVKSEIKKRWQIQPQAETMFGLFLSLVVDTVDPYKQNRVRFFNPLFHDPNTPIEALPFAWPISAMGGFDDCGLNWVPPAGSTLCVIFAGGHRSAPYYIGTTWHVNRGPDGEHNWGYNINEYYQIHEGHRKGYLAGKDDGSQVLPQWNTENYNGYDIDSIVDFNNDPEAQRKITYPNIYGFKTPQKHMMKMVDGDYKCNHKNKRLEILSGCGNWMIFKDDHLHDCGSWVHPDVIGKPHVDCNSESTECQGESTNSSVQKQGGNQYFKHLNEARPYKGPGTPQNNKCSLPQSGIQFLSIAGHSFVMDDSVEQPSGVPNWERSTKQFDFGCNDKFVGKTFWVSATGHRIEMNDLESQSQLRGEENYIRIVSASGNKIELNDHTTGKEGCPGFPPNVAGSKRGITMQSTSNHTFEMIDEENEQASPCRTEGGVPIPKAKKAFVRLRTGYGLEFTMRDDNSQEETQTQHIQIFCPQKDNEDRGPHIMRFQERASGPGQVFLRAGGDYVCSTYDSHVTMVGDKDENPSNKITVVSKNTIISTEEFYYNVADVHAFLADQVILLMAGKDCKPVEGDECGPCVWPVLCLTPKGVTISDRVFASASPNAGCAHIFHLLPFHSCTPWEGC